MHIEIFFFGLCHFLCCGLEKQNTVIGMHRFVLTVRRQTPSRKPSKVCMIMKCPAFPAQIILHCPQTKRGKESCNSGSPPNYFAKYSLKQNKATLPKDLFLWGMTTPPNKTSVETRMKYSHYIAYNFSHNIIYNFLWKKGLIRIHTSGMDMTTLVQQDDKFTYDIDLFKTHTCFHYTLNWLLPS